jgi:hypothetical protein
MHAAVGTTQRPPDAQKGTGGLQFVVPLRLRSERAMGPEPTRPSLGNLTAANALQVLPEQVDVLTGKHFRFAYQREVRLA